MKLRNPADRRTLLWAFVFFPGVALAQYAVPALAGWTLPLSLYLAYCAAIFSHNHNHCPTFAGRRSNAFFSAWISVFYGYPTFAWIPTHNLNHHKYVDRAGDATITWRLTTKNTFLMAFIYFFVFNGGFHTVHHEHPGVHWSKYPALHQAIADQIDPALQESSIIGYTFKAYLLGAVLPRFRTRQIVIQYLVVIGAHLGMAALAVALHGWRLGLFVYLSALGFPALFALWAIMYTNYIQHVHCDPWSKHNHSRNFVSPTNNYFVFNGGFHTVHHEHPGVHWSRYPALHAQIAHEIHPALNESSIVGYTVKQYILGGFIPRLRTRQIGRAAYDAGSAPQDLTTATIGDAAEVGVTAQAL